MFIAFIPFSTALLGEYNDQEISVMIYGINLAIAAFCSVQWWYATKDHRLMDPDVDPNIITIMSRKILVDPIFYLIAVALSFVSIPVSLVLFVTIPIYYLVPVQKDKSRFWFTKTE